MKYKALYISDVHLGLSSLRLDELTKFIKDNKFENIFLVGDIIDHWKLKRRWHWNESYNKFVRRIIKESEKTNVVYITGNHDDFLRELTGQSIGKIKIVDEYIFENTTLIVHGDLFDTVIQTSPWLAKLGAVGYELLLKMNRGYDFIRRVIFRRKTHWSLSKAIKAKVKNAATFIGNFEECLTNHAKSLHCDTVVCGHIHTPKVDLINNVLYVNCGDFVESRSVVVQTYETGAEKFKHIFFD